MEWNDSVLLDDTECVRYSILAMNTIGEQKLFPCDNQEEEEDDSVRNKATRPVRVQLSTEK